MPIYIGLFEETPELVYMQITSQGRYELFWQGGVSPTIDSGDTLIEYVIQIARDVPIFFPVVSVSRKMNTIIQLIRESHVCESFLIFQS